MHKYRTLFSTRWQDCPLVWLSNKSLCHSRIVLPVYTVIFFVCIWRIPRQIFFLYGRVIPSCTFNFVFQADFLLLHRRHHSCIVLPKDYGSVQWKKNKKKQIGPCYLYTGISLDNALEKYLQTNACNLSCVSDLRGAKDSKEVIQRWWMQYTDTIKIFLRIEKQCYTWQYHLHHVSC